MDCGKSCLSNLDACGTLCSWGLKLPEERTIGEMRDRMIKRMLGLMMALLLVVALMGQGLAEGAAEKKVMTSFYPLYIFASNLLEGVPGVKLQNLTHPSTGCLHDYQLLTSDLRSLSDADLLIINGGGMESFLETLTQQFPALKVADSSKGIALIPAEELLEEHDGEAHGNDGEDHDHEGADHDHEHDHGEYNAHIWLDPRNAILMSYNMAAALTELMPEHAEQINRNLLAYDQRLEALDEELQLALMPLLRREIVTFHEAFPYFARAYGLNVVAVLALEPEESLSPAMLSELVARVKQHNNPPLFTEPQYEDRAARAVAQETGAKVYELDPIVTGEGSLDAYEAGMRKNAQVLIEALGTGE